MVLLGFAGLVAGISQRNLRPFVAAGFIIFLIGLIVLGALTPGIYYLLQHGTNPTVAHRPLTG